MKASLLALAIIVALSACNSGKGNVKKEETSSTGSTTPNANIASPSGSIDVATLIPYSKDNTVAENIKNECKLNAKLSQFIESFSEKNGVQINRSDAVDHKIAQNALLVEITDAVSERTAFLGHKKSTSISGKLYKNGEFISSFEGRRVTGGGAFGGYKGSCAVLNRTVKALGKDVARWLKNPVNKARIGDL